MQQQLMSQFVWRRLKPNFMFLLLRTKVGSATSDENLTEWMEDNYGKDVEGRFIDWMYLKVKAGDGGGGAAHLKRGRRLLGPDGGDGGRGGDISVMADNSQKSLTGIKRHYKAENGGKGGSNFSRGRNGKGITIKVPVGTVVKCDDRKEILADLASHGNTFVVATGGIGGYGNANFKSSTDQSPMEATAGVPGEEATIELEMKSIADVGLVGFPNAGKSTLLRALSRAKPAVASYPFTTLKPKIGIIGYKDMLQIAVADIPGLVKGAHANKGLGHSFLRHIERCSTLLYVIDINDDNFIENYEILREEVSLYNKELLTLPTAIVANKIDTLERDCESIERIAKSVDVPVIGISGKLSLNIDSLKELIRRMVGSVKTL
eukprot:gene11983-2566_t